MEPKKISPANAEVRADFGHAIALDENYLLVGSPSKTVMDSAGTSFQEAGPVTFFQRDPSLDLEVPPSNSGFRIFPNPFSQALTVESPLPHKSMRVTLYHATGQIAKSEEIPSSYGTIEFSPLPAGYIGWKLGLKEFVPIEPSFKNDEFTL